MHMHITANPSWVTRGWSLLRVLSSRACQALGRDKGAVVTAHIFLHYLVEHDSCGSGLVVQVPAPQLIHWVGLWPGSHWLAQWATFNAAHTHCAHGRHRRPHV